jgi:hypothetical protein
MLLPAHQTEHDPNYGHSGELERSTTGRNRGLLGSPTSTYAHF